MEHVFQRVAQAVNISERRLWHYDRQMREKGHDGLSPVAEHMQLVHYYEGQEYKPHHGSVAVRYDTVILLPVLRTA